MAEITPAPKPTAGSKVGGAARRFFRHENAILAIVMVALIAGIGAVTKGLTLGRANVANVLLQSAITGVASVGQTFAILTAGIDLTVGGVGLFTSILGASLMTSVVEQNIAGSPLSIYTAIPIMILAGAAWGTANGSLISRVGMPPLIVTLGIWQICDGAAFQVSKGKYIIDLPENLNFMGSGDIGGVPVLVIIFIITAVVGYFVLNHTVFGRCVYSVGSNPLSAWLSGINVKRVLLIVYIISGLLAGLAGAMMTARSMSASMQTLGGFELNTIAAACVGGVSLAGGKGNIIGVVLGVLIIGIINNGMSIMGATVTAQGIATGVIIIVAVAIDYLRRRQS
jgi:ribose/xylose/arabinose/galactoside ABC-type transport system permease subunit